MIIQTQDLIHSIDELSINKWKEIQSALKDIKGISSITFSIILSKETLDRLKLTEDFHFVVVNDNGYGRMEYYYKGRKITPDCYYVRPDNYNEVSLMEILQECIKQDTYQPDIKPIENKLNVI